MKPTPERHDALRCVAAFDTLSDAELDSVIVNGTERRLGAGDVLFAEGEPGRTMALVLSGTLMVTRRGPRGTPVRLTTIRHGELVGELVCVDPAPRLATVTARVPTLVLEIDRTGLEQLMDSAPRVASQLLSMIIKRTTRRLREVDDAIAAQFGEAKPPAEPPPAPEAAPEPTGWRKLLNRFMGST